MKTITGRLLELDPTLKAYNEGQWGTDLPWSTGFHSFNDAGIECETGEFLYSLVRMLQPKNVLETGTHWGVGSSYMGLALQDNSFGKLDTVEFLPDIWMRAKKRFTDIGLNDFINSHFGDVAQFDPGDKKYDLILLDTEPQTRFAELVKFFPYLNPGGYIFIHDLHRHMHQIPNEEHGFAWPYGMIPDQMKELVKTGQLRPFHFTTPRGFTGFYKVSPDDYLWE